MDRSDIFVADTHIKSMDDAVTVKFIGFLDQIKGSTKTLYILGDLFDFWFGGARTSPFMYELYKPVIDKLKELADAGVQIVYFEGNHDFFMGDIFTGRLRAKVYPSGAKLDVDGKIFSLSHGDTINRKDTLYILWRRVIRSPFMYWLMNALPPERLLSIAKALSSKSRNHSGDRASLEEKVLDGYINDNNNDGAFAVIFAHTHSPVLEERGKKICVNPGAFSDNGSYARFKNGSFSLENY